MLENKYLKVVVVYNRVPTGHVDRVCMCCVVQQCALLRKQYTYPISECIYSPEIVYSLCSVNTLQAYSVPPVSIKKSLFIRIAKIGIY